MLTTCISIGHISRCLTIYRTLSVEPRLCLCLPDASCDSVVLVSDFTEKKKYRKSESKEEGKDQASIQSSTTPDPGHCIGE